MATGDFVSVAMNADAQVELVVEGDYSAATDFESGKAATIGCTIPGYTSGASDPKSFTGVALKFKSATYAAPNTTFVLQPKIWVTSGATSITLDADAGLFNNGTATAAVSGQATSNAANTVAEHKPTVHVRSRLYQKQTSTFYVDVEAYGPVYPGHEDNFGIDRVKVAITDNDGAGTTKTLTADTVTQIAADSNGKYANVTVFRVGPFDVADWDGGGTDATDDKWLVIVPTAYATVGGTRDGQTEYHFANPNADITGNEAWVDASGTMTLSVGISGDIAAGDLITGVTSGADAVVGAAATTGATSLTIHHSEGTWTSGEAITINTLAGSETGTLSGTPSFTADDATGAVGSSATPYRSISAAGRAIQNANTSGKASWGTIYLQEGWHTLGDYAAGTAWNTTDGPLTITRASGTTKASVRLCRSNDSNGVRTNVYRLYDITVQATHHSTAVIRTANPSTASTVWTSTDNIIIADSVDFIGIGLATDGTTLFSGFEREYAYNCTGDELSGGVTASSCVIDCTATCSVNLAVFSSTDHQILSNIDGVLDRSGRGDHSDVWQSINSGTVTRANRAFTNSFIDLSSTASEQIAPFSNNQGTETWEGVAIVNTIQKGNGTTEGSNYGAIDDVVLKGVYFYHNSTSAGMRLRDDASKYDDQGLYIQRCVFGNVTKTGTPGPYYACGKYENAVSQAAGDFAFDSTITDSGDAFVNDTWIDDFSADDWNPVGSGDLYGVWTGTPISPYDAAGTAVADDAGYIGALLANAPTISDVSPATVAVGATVDLTVTGTGFVDGVVASSTDAGFTVNSETWVSATEVTVNVTGVTAGTYTGDLVLTNPDGQTATETIEVTSSNKTLGYRQRSRLLGTQGKEGTLP